MKARASLVIVPLMLAARVALADQAPTAQTQQEAPPPADPAPVQPVQLPPPEAPPVVNPPSPPPSPPIVVSPARVQPNNDGSQLAATGMMGPRERLTTWDLNLDGAYGKIFGDPSSEWTGFGRVRIGVLHVHNEMYFMLGGTYEISDRIAATFGIQGEVMHLSSGFWGQVGGLLDIRPRPGFMASVGWSLFGVELQQRNDEQFGAVTSFYGKIRIPVRIIIKALDK